MSTLGTLLLLLLTILLIAVLPYWKWSKQWHYGPAFVIGLFIVGLLLHIVNRRI